MLVGTLQGVHCKPAIVLPLPPNHVDVLEQRHRSPSGIRVRGDVFPCQFPPGFGQHESRRNRPHTQRTPYRQVVIPLEPGQQTIDQTEFQPQMLGQLPTHHLAFVIQRFQNQLLDYRRRDSGVLDQFRHRRHQFRRLRKSVEIKKRGETV